MNARAPPRRDNDREIFFFQTSKKWTSETCGFSRMEPHSTRLNGFVKISFPRPPHLSQRRSPKAGTLSRFDSMRFFLFLGGLFEIPGLCRSTTDRNSPQEQHSRRHYQHTDWYAAKSGEELLKSSWSLYTQWGSPFDRCDFQNRTKKNLGCCTSQKKN